MNKRYYFKLEGARYLVFDTFQNPGFVTDFSNRDDAVSFCATRNYELEQQLLEDKNLSE